MNSMLGVFLLGTLVTAVSADDKTIDEAQLEADAVVIGQIVLKKNDVFDLTDERENNFLYRLVNKLHIITKDHVIEKQLLLKPGEAYSKRLVDESERILRRKNYLYEATIEPVNHSDGSVDLNWKMLAQPHQTIVIYMGLHGLPIICEQLVAHGLPADTPAALIQQGTTRNQQVFTATLATLVNTLADAGGAKAPTLIVVGEVVALREKLSWFNPRDSAAELNLLHGQHAIAQGRSADPFERSIDVLVGRLRKRLGDTAREPQILKTVRSEGYVLTSRITVE